MYRVDWLFLFRRNRNLLQRAYQLTAGKPGTLMMDSKRLFIFIALWMFLSCVLKLDHAEGFIIPHEKGKDSSKENKTEKNS